MTRKDFIAIAAVIRRHRKANLEMGDPGSLLYLLATDKKLSIDLADVLAKSNPRFDRERFLAACDPEK